MEQLSNQKTARQQDKLQEMHHGPVPIEKLWLAGEALEIMGLPGPAGGDAGGDYEERRDGGLGGNRGEKGWSLSKKVQPELTIEPEGARGRGELLARARARVCKLSSVTIGGHVGPPSPLDLNGMNWMLIEDVALCTSWVEVTHDPIMGNEMQLREMWSLIHTNYLEKMGGKRTKESMSSCWKILSQSFSMWRDVLAKASSNLRNGENLTDQTLQAQVWYNAKSKNQKQSFTRWECWNIVKDCPKFRVMPVGLEVVMNNTPIHSTLHSTPDHDSHVHEDDAEEVPETPP
ncbi:peptidyl-prolyl cis-trans isomerase FKBP42-like [Pyrus ussuriensis x Pyrus communis]|uniref:Peptidyl-prolyl cis-trans isomerase FKBP42-like n=1 Tax=Pyrus ussuriensis x Pyrus communis TaxID=2448454 RepID=A0A5N5H671_9ROSA|nr:peptidyl-prolyl cis-trans isomerase FKBP42-like [Pyrus ussuriensis x Pyrus communis]